jgi:AraC-like DNA-binding protein
MDNRGLPILWVACCDGHSGADLFDECRRLSAVTKCGPAKALNLLAGGPYLAVVFEFGDPDASDLQLLQSVKRRHPSVPIVMITEAHSEELAVWAFRVRVWNYLVKPIPLRDLKVTVRQLTVIAKRRVESRSRVVERPAALLPARQSPAEPPSEAAMLRRAVQHIQLNYMMRLSIHKLARECGMSRFRFSRLFRDTYGLSCRDYVMRLRLDKACTLLETPNASVTAVAGTTGFADSSYFARVFRRHVGRSPTEYSRWTLREAAATTELS